MWHLCELLACAVALCSPQQTMAPLPKLGWSVLRDKQLLCCKRLSALSGLRNKTQAACSRVVAHTGFELKSCSLNLSSILLRMLPAIKPNLADRACICLRSLQLQQATHSTASASTATRWIDQITLIMLSLLQQPCKGLQSLILLFEFNINAMHVRL